MQQNNFLFVTGFSQKPDILKRNHSFLNNSNNGQGDEQQQQDQSQSKKCQIDFVQKNKVILKVQKNNGNNSIIIKQSSQIKQQQPQAIIKKITDSKRLNQSVSYEDDDSQELNSHVMKLSQSFDVNIMKAKKILRRIIPKNQMHQNQNNQHPRSYSSIDSKYIEEQSEDQTKFRTNYQTFEQNKENYDLNFVVDGNNNNNDISQDKENELKYKNTMNVQQGYNTGFSFSNLGINNGGEQQNNIGIKCVTQPDLDEINQDELNNHSSSINNVKKKQIIISKKGRVLSTNDIIKDSYFSQDIVKDNKKNTQIILNDVKRNDIKNIVNQSLGLPSVDINDINLDNHNSNNNKQKRIIKKSNEMEYKLIDSYNKQNIQVNNQMINYNSNITTTNQNANTTNITTTSNIDQQSNINYEIIIKNEEERIKACNLKEKNSINKMSISSLEQNQNKSDNEQKQNDQSLDVNFNQQNNLVQSNSNDIINQNEIKSNNRIVLNRNYDYSIGVKNPILISNDNKQSQQNNNNNNNNTEKSSKQSQQIPKGLGQMKQTLVLFQNSKKKDINQLQNQAQNSSLFQMETIKESGFLPHTNIQNNQRQAQKSIINQQQITKKINFKNSQMIPPNNINNNFQSQPDMSNTSGRALTEPSNHYQYQQLYDSYLNCSYTPLSLQKKGKNSQVKQPQPKNFNNFLEEFNLDSISIGGQQTLTKNSSKSRSNNQQTYLFEINTKNNQNNNNNNYNFNINIKNNQNNNRNNNPNNNYVKSASSMSFNETNDQNKSYNMISHPPLLSLQQTQDNNNNNLSEKSDSTKYIPFSMYGNSMPISHSNQSRKSGGTGGQPSVFEFQEVKHYLERSLSQQSSREQQQPQMNFNLNDGYNQQNNNMNYSKSQNKQYQFQNFQPNSLNIAPPSCSSAQSNYNNTSSNQLIQKQNKLLNQSMNSNSSKNCLGYINQNNIMREMYNELDEEVRIFDFSPKTINALRSQNNNLQKSTLMSTSSLFDFNNTSMTASALLSRTNTAIPSQTNDFKKFNDISKQCLTKLEQTISPADTNQIINQYFDQARSKITYLKNKKKNTELDLVLLNRQIIQNIESTNNDFKQKMPHHLSQQLEELYQQIKKNIFVYSCQ